MKLYEISQMYSDTLSDMREAGSTVEELDAVMDLMVGQFEEKAIAVVSYFKNQEADIKAMKDYEKAMKARRLPLEKQVASLKDYLLRNMQGSEITKIECPEFAIKVRTNAEAVTILNADEVPDEFVTETVVRTIDKMAVKKAIQSGQGVAGCRLDRSQTLNIK